jgi:protein Tex
MTIEHYIQQYTNLPEKQISACLQLLDQDCSLAFIARYRKDQTGNLDEVQIEQIIKQKKTYVELCKRQESIIKSIEEQALLSPELAQKIKNCFDATALEDLYLPFKKKKNTRAQVAREAGLEPLAKMIMAQNSVAYQQKAEQYIHEKFPDAQAVLQGARDIVAEWISENAFYRKLLRSFFKKNAQLQAKVIKTKQESPEAQKYKNYFDWNEALLHCPSHRLLAILRAEAEGFVRSKVLIDAQEATALVAKHLIKNNQIPCLTLALEDAFKRLIEPSLSNEIMAEVKLKADEKAIGIFAKNLQQLLLQAPLGPKRVLGMDPGFRSGCKLVCLNEQGDLLHNETIYPHAPQHETAMAIKKIKSMVQAYQIEAIAIGNGTASRETEQLIKKIAFEQDLQVFVVSEAGASVYSASKIARDEFPNYDVTVRGAVSIARRLADPLAELVKIDAKAIGVGQYQHDVNQSLLKEELDKTVMHCVNLVGVNPNTASKALLSYVSGIGEKMASNIVDFRTENGPFASRAALKKVPRLGEKVFQQASAFLRLPQADHPLDNSAIHPEAYAVVSQMAKDLKLPLEDLIGNPEHIKQIDQAKYETQLGKLALQDILKELQKPNLDPRKASALFEFANIKTLQDLQVGMLLPGIINNITAFGCFVDVGIKESGLVHISQLKAGFVSDVNEVVKLHQQVQVKVLGIDFEQKRLQLSMILA